MRVFQKIFCLPSKNCVKNHTRDVKLDLGFNNSIISKAVDLYAGEPVVDATDEARILRFLNPVLNDKGEIEIVGHCWSPDCNHWEDSRNLLKDIVSNEECSDQFTALKLFVDEIIKSDNLAKDVGIHNFAATSGIHHKPLVYLLWPTPNKGYKGYHLLKVWDQVRYKCFMSDDGESLKEKPVNVVGHASDSVGVCCQTG